MGRLHANLRLNQASSLLLLLGPHLCGNRQRNETQAFGARTRVWRIPTMLVAPKSRRSKEQINPDNSLERAIAHMARDMPPCLIRTRRKMSGPLYDHCQWEQHTPVSGVPKSRPTLKESLTLHTAEWRYQFIVLPGKLHCWMGVE